jgi:choline-phosphate cytidylyltransferase
MNLDSIDGKHARRTNNSSAIGELFDHALDNISLVLMIMTGFNLWEVHNRNFILSTIFFTSIVFLHYHLEAYLSANKTLVFGEYNGQTEAVFTYCGILLISMFRNYLPDVLFSLSPYIPYTMNTVATLYILANTIISILTWRSERSQISITDHQYVYSMFGLSLGYIIRAFGTFGSAEIGGQIGYLAEGFILSIPTTEIILCKMSNKHFNPVIVVLIMASVVDNFLAILITLGYYCYLFFYLSEKLNIPLFRVKTRVYCCGVFDMCHRGHMVLFQRTASLGDELIVGVHNDEDVASYKRKPNVSHEERCETVAVCKYVSKIVPNAPLVMDECFIRQHHIDIVVCSDEYDQADDKYYAVPRKLGILKVLPRTKGISSTDLMRIVMARVDKKLNANEKTD